MVPWRLRGQGLGMALAAALLCTSRAAGVVTRPFVTVEQRHGTRSPVRVLPGASSPVVPVAMLGRLGKGIADALQRLKDGSKQLVVNTKELGPLRKRWAAGEDLSFEVSSCVSPSWAHRKMLVVDGCKGTYLWEYNLMQRTSGDCAKAVGLTLFTITKPELAPFLCSFFPQVVPSTFLTLEDKLRRCQQRNFNRVKGVVNHLVNLQQEMFIPQKQDGPKVKHLRTLETILKARDRGTKEALKHAEALIYRAPMESTKPVKETKRPKGPKADLRDVPRPILVAVCQSIGMIHRFIPTGGLRAMLGDYLDKISESDTVLLRSNLSKIGREDLIDACSQRAISLGDTTDAKLRANLNAYLKTIQSPPVSAPKGSTDLELNEKNLKFALLGLNMAGLVRDAPENSGLRALFGCA